MSRPRISRIVLALCICLLAVCNVTMAKDPKDFVVHEWGTFSTFSGSDGVQLKFYPNDGDLPQFVYNRHRFEKGGLPDAFVSLETPVMYFYSDRDRTASVKVEFPKGLMTDWYPQASRLPVQDLRWDNIKILAKDAPKPIENGGKSRYFAARETDSAELQVIEKGKRENEKFLFYRGVGDFSMPFAIRSQGNGSFTVKNNSKDEVPGLFLVRVQGGTVYFKASGHLSPRDQVRLQESTSASTAEKLGAAVADLLIEQGLYEKEARAMVKTWSADWFGQDGMRVLYLVPESLTKEMLPLQINPKPDQLVRVLVGRHDILTPEREKDIDALVKRVKSDSNRDS